MLDSISKTQVGDLPSESPRTNSNRENGKGLTERILRMKITAIIEIDCEVDGEYSSKLKEIAKTRIGLNFLDSLPKVVEINDDCYLIFRSQSAEVKIEEQL